MPIVHLDELFVEFIAVGLACEVRVRLGLRYEGVEVAWVEIFGVLGVHREIVRFNLPNFYFYFCWVWHCRWTVVAEKIGKWLISIWWWDWFIYHVWVVILLSLGQSSTSSSCFWMLKRIRNCLTRLSPLRLKPPVFFQLFGNSRWNFWLFCFTFNHC